MYLTQEADVDVAQSGGARLVHDEDCELNVQVKQAPSGVLSTSAAMYLLYDYVRLHEG